MSGKFITALAAGALAAGVLATAWHLADNLQFSIFNFQNGESQAVPDPLALLKEVTTPPPLRGPSEERQVTLTADGVFLHTNSQRRQNSVPQLARNAALDRAAVNKAADLLAKQYFEHVSPSGQGPADVVDAVGYAYIRVGENLALGNFASDEALVQAWMDSPGHRANIVDRGFTEIGIAAVQGIYEGRRTWVAVQTFGTPTSACSTPSAALQTQVDTQNGQLTALDQTLRQIKKDMEAVEEDPARREELRQQYNAKVDEFNALQKQLKQTVDTYNGQVKTYNACVENFSR